MKIRFFIFIFLIAAVILGALIWWNQAISPADKEDTANKVFIIKRGDDVRTIAKNLQNNGLIRDPIAFFLYVRFGGLQKNIQSGDFRLSPSQDLKSIASTLTHGTLDVWLTTLEGWRNEEIAILLAQKLNVPETEFLKYAKEGYMFPDTYLVPKDATAGAVVNLFINNFNKKVKTGIINQVQQKGMALNDVVIVASMVEREARYDSDRPIVASIILNRLKLGMKLDVDATVQYALGYQSDGKTWWKKDLTLDDLSINSAYNTYKNNGLPPAPVANPGLAAIIATINAPKTDYLYYISDKAGRIHPAKTIEEHNANIQKYLNR